MFCSTLAAFPYHMAYVAMGKYISEWIMLDFSSVSHPPGVRRTGEIHQRVDYVRL